LRRDHAVFFHVRLEGTVLSWDHDHLLPRNQVCPRRRSEGHDRHIFRYCHDVVATEFTARPGVTRIETSIIFDARRRYELPVFRSLK
jgi:hypothetical protein